MNSPSDTEEFYDCQGDDTFLPGKLSLFKGSLLTANNAPSINPSLPPSSFKNTFRTKVARECHNYALLLWLLNSEQVSLTYHSDYQVNAFQVFKHNEQKLYQRHLDIRQMPLDIGDISMDATLVPDDTDGFDTSKFECSIYPILLQKTNYDHFQMDRLAEDYRLQFVKILENFEYQKVKHPKFAMLYLQQNLTLLTRAYIRDLFYDITFKYSSWSSAGSSEKVHLLKSLQRYHKEHTFIISHESIASFTEKLDHLTCLNYASSDEINTTLTYGVWIDTERGIILLCNGIAHTWDIMQIPSYSYKQSDDITAFVKKYMLFCNMSALETCMWFL
ncbi:Non-disjunction protein 1 [Kluyveromyces marxianus]